MVEVISPEGVRIVYKEADSIRWDHTDKVGLYEGDPDKRGRFIAGIPKDWAISFDRACEVHYSEPVGPIRAEIALDIVSRCLRSFRSWKDTKVLCDMKRKLREFNITTRKWS